MRLEKPEIETIYVTFLDRKSGKSASMTVYNATPEEVRETLQDALKDKPRKARRETAGAAH